MANTLPFRLAALGRLTTVLASITPGAGYTYDLTNSVFRGRGWFGDEDPLPMVALIEPPIPVEPFLTQADNPANQYTWDMMVQGFVDDDKRHPTDPAHMLLADVRKRLALEKANKHVDRGLLGFGLSTNTVLDMILGDPKVRPSDEVSAKAYFWLPLSLSVVETPSDPLNYTLTP